MIILTCLAFALCLARLQFLASRNMNAHWNGYGVIEGVQNKRVDAPMAYRVLVPWLIGKPTMAKYQALQVTFITGALYSVYLAWGAPVMLVSCVLLAMTFYYDYWDWTAELAGFSLALVSLPLAIVGVIFHGLSRETAPLPGLVYALHFHDFLGGLIVSLTGITILLYVRIIQGKHPLYCDRWMWKRNLKELRALKLGSLFSVGLSVLALLGAWGRLGGLVVPVMLGAGWLMAVAAETRVFVPVIPYAAAFLVGVM